MFYKLKTLVKKQLEGLNTKLFLYGKKSRLIILILLIVVSVFFWKLKYNFYFWDEFEWLKAFSNNNFSFFTPHNEHFLPLMKVFYWFQVIVLHLKPSVMQIILLLLHSFTAISIGYLLWKIIKNNLISLLAIVVFLFHPFNYENLTWLFQTQIIVNELSYILALVFIARFSQSKKMLDYYVSLFFTIFQSYWFGNGLILSFIIGIYFLISNKEKTFKKLLLMSLPYFIIFILNLLIYRLFSFQNVTLNTGGSLTTDQIPQIFSYFLNAIFYNLPRVIILINKPSLIMAIITIAIFLIVVIHTFTKEKRQNKLQILFFIISYFLSFLLISVTRFKFGNEQSFASRYVYYFLPPVILVLGICFNFMKDQILKVVNLRLTLLLITITVMIFLVISSIYAKKYKNEIDNRNFENIQTVNKVMNKNIDSFKSEEIFPGLNKDDLWKIFSNVNY